jgi:hypothetical protein
VACDESASSDEAADTGDRVVKKARVGPAEETAERGVAWVNGGDLRDHLADCGASRVDIDGISPDMFFTESAAQALCLELSPGVNWVCSRALLLRG